MKMAAFAIHMSLLDTFKNLNNFMVGDTIY
jgi:hypothetical protein